MVSSCNNKTKRFYTDIYVQIDDCNAIAIELKFKTKRENVTEYLDDDFANQGATPEGRFDYLFDINRLECLVYKDKKFEIEKKIRDLNSDFKLDKNLEAVNIIGYAIMVTNDTSYCNISKDLVKKYKKTPQYRDFCIAHGDKIEKDKKLDWIKTNNEYNKSVRGTFRARPLEFLNDYKFSWVNLDNKFKVLVTEVKGE